MTTTCVISNFNYASYVCDAINGALLQTVPFDQIVVVDDGSTDGSLELLTTRYRNHPTVEIVSKSNEGQLSCFNQGFAHATGDIVFFLDADDIYEPNYVEQALKIYSGYRDCDFVFCGRRLFGRQEGLLLQFDRNRDLGYSVIQTAYHRKWIGAATSCLSIRRSVLEKILPLPFEDDWRVRADDCLVFGASLAGARKRYLAQPLVRYRVHEKNNFRGRADNLSATYRRRLAINRLFEHLERKFCYNVPRFPEFAHREFRTIEKPTLAQLVSYAHICMGGGTSYIRRISSTLVAVRHYLEALRSDRARIQPEKPQLNIRKNAAA